ASRLGPIGGLLAGVRSKELDAALLAGDGDLTSVRPKCNGGRPLQRTIDDEALARGGGIPDLHGADHVARGDAPVARAQRDTSDRCRVAAQEKQFAPRSHIPDAYRAVAACGSQFLAVGVEGDVEHGAVVSATGIAQLARGCVPEAHIAVAATARQPAVVRAEDGGLHLTWMLERKALLAGGNIPDSDRGVVAGCGEPLAVFTEFEAAHRRALFPDHGVFARLHIPHDH